MNVEPLALGPARSESPQNTRRARRIDGEQARQRLLFTALRLFAANGYSKTSTREIAQAADVNIAAISYYFGDKAALYRAVFVEPMGCQSEDVTLFTKPGITLLEALTGFYAGFLAPMKQGDLSQQCVRLHFREMIEPTGLWSQEIEQGIKPAHQALCGVLCKHLTLREPDAEVHRLAFAITALGLQMFVGRDLIDAIAPDLANSSAAIDEAVQRFAQFALAMVDSESRRRARQTVNRHSRTK